MAGSRARLGVGIAGVALIALFWLTATVSDFFLGRPFVYTGAEEWSETLVRSSGRFPGPFESAFYVVAAVLLVPAIVCLVVHASTLRVNPLGDVFARLGASPETIAVGLSALATLGAALVTIGAVDGTLILDDERAYLFQAELFRHGHLSLPGVPTALHNPMILSHPWMGKYPPGQSLVLLPGVLLGMPHVVPPVVAGLLVFFTFGFVREAFGQKQGLLAAALLAASPFVWCSSATCTSFSTTACGFMLTLWLFARGRRDGRWVSYAAAGAALGFTGLVRPFDAVALGLPIVAWLVWDAARATSGPRWPIIPFGCACLALVGVHLAYNWLAVGSPLTLPYALAGEFDIGFFNRPMPGFSYRHTPTQGLAQLSVALVRLDVWLFGWPGGLLLVLAGGLTAEGAYDRLLLALAASFAVAYTIPNTTGTWDVGPTYFFTLAPILVILAVRGVRALSARFAADERASRAVAFLPIVGACVALTTVTPLHILRLGALSGEIQAPWKAVEEAGLGDSIVVLPNAGLMAAAGYSLGYPYELKSGTGTAHMIRPLSRPELEEARRFLGESLPVYRLTLDVEVFGRRGVRRYDFKPLI